MGHLRPDTRQRATCPRRSQAAADSRGETYTLAAPDPHPGPAPRPSEAVGLEDLPSTQHGKAWTIETVGQAGARQPTGIGVWGILAGAGSAPAPPRAAPLSRRLQQLDPPRQHAPGGDGRRSEDAGQECLANLPRPDVDAEAGDRAGSEDCAAAAQYGEDHLGREGGLARALHGCGHKRLQGPIGATASVPARSYELGTPRLPVERRSAGCTAHPSNYPRQNSGRLPSPSATAGMQPRQSERKAATGKPG